ncbi:hypothetical protein Tco_0546246 [Tanacetum coccineum]
MGEKLTIERLTNEKILVDDSLFLLNKDEGKMGAYVEKLKILLDEVKADMPNPPSRNTGDVIGVRHVIHSESHEIHPESHEIQSESHEIQSQSHKIQSESLWITSDSL